MATAVVSYGKPGTLPTEGVAVGSAEAQPSPDAQAYTNMADQNSSPCTQKDRALGIT